MNAATPFEDTLSRFVFERAAVRGAIVALDRSCADILACHRYPPALRRTLAELLAASVLLASTLKFAGTLTVQLQGDGPVRLLVVECDARLSLRATAQWNAAAEALPGEATLCEQAGGPAHGRLAITLDPGDGGPLYQGIVGLEATSIAALIEHYLATSEQIASRVLVAATGNRVRGLVLQRLPGATASDLITWSEAIARLAAPSARRLDGESAAALLQALFPENDLRLFAPQPARFHCRCSSERVAVALRLLGRAEVDGIVAEQGSVSVACEFCNRRYAFDADAVRALFGPSAAGPAPIRH